MFSRSAAVIGMMFLRFGAVGILLTGVSLGVFLALVHAGFHYLVATCLSWALSTGLGFSLNRRQTFRHEGPASFRIIASYIAAALLQLVLAAVGLAILMDGLGLSPEIACVVNIAVVSVLNFTVLRLFVFHHRDSTTVRA